MRRRAPDKGRERQREETRARLFEAALEIFRRDGVQDCRIDDIASAAQVSRAAFYFHFPTKEDVLLELQRRTDEQVAEGVRGLPEGEPLRKVLDALAQSLKRVWEADARLFPDVVVAFLRTGAQTTLADREYGAVRQVLARRFRLAAQRGELKDLIAPELLSDIYLANVLGGMLGWCSQQPLVSLDQVLAIITMLFLEGVGLTPVKKPRR